jgi:hypothetical protein
MLGIIIIPTDELIFFRGVGIPPTRLIFPQLIGFAPSRCFDVPDWFDVGGKMSFAPTDPPGEEWAFNHGGMGAQFSGLFQSITGKARNTRKKRFL